MKKIVLLIAVVLLSVSCSKFSFHSYNDFKDNRWQKEDVQQYEVILASKLNNAAVKVFLSHVHEPGYTQVPVTLEMIYPGGKSESIPVTLELKDKEGNSISDCSGDICDNYTIVKEGLNLEKGTYTFRLKNNVNNAFLPNVLAAGVEVVGH